MKTLGELMCVAGCTLWALQYLKENKRRIEALQNISNALILINGELCTRLTPMPELMHMAAESSYGDAKMFFHRIEAALSYLGEVSFGEIWNQSLYASFGWLDSEQKRMLSCPGSVLGTSSCETQSEVLKNTISYMQKETESMKDRFRRTRRLIPGLSVSAGLLIVIVLG